MWDRSFLRRLAFSGAVAAASLCSIGGAHAQPAAWRWTAIAPSATAIDHFAGNGNVEISKASIKANLKEEKNRTDPFVFQGSINQQNQVSGLLKWPNSDAGDVQLRGQLRQTKLPDGSTYRMIWLLDSRTGIYLVLTQEMAAKASRAPSK